MVFKYHMACFVSRELLFGNLYKARNLKGLVQMSERPKRYVMLFYKFPFYGNIFLHKLKFLID